MMVCLRGLELNFKAQLLCRKINSYFVLPRTSFLYIFMKRMSDLSKFLDQLYKYCCCDFQSIKNNIGFS